MTAATEPGPRIISLDVVRGVAVMGILAMNIVAFAMPFEAYMNPPAFGAEETADLLSWLVSFVLVEGKMRGLFSLLFGASMLLVMDRAAAAGEAPEKVHFRRMAWLLLFGLLHFYFIWFGDILSLYAPVGMAAWFFHHKSTRALIRWGVALVVFQFLIFAAMAIGFHSASEAASAPGASAEALRAWSAMKAEFEVPAPAALAEVVDTYRGGYAGIFGHRLETYGALPFISLFLFGPETLGYMLFGMAALRSGYLAGAWPKQRYRHAAMLGFGFGIPASGLIAALVWATGFHALAIVDAMAATTLVRPPMIVATAALVILLARPNGQLTARIAAAGRAAFSNYLGASILMTTLFYGYGFGLFGTLSRVQLWPVVFAAWALMLLWSKPWLDRFRYGPFEWLWRSLARWEVQPLRKAN